MCRYFILIFFVIFFGGCLDEKKKVDVSHIEVPLKFIRSESALQKVTTEQALDQLIQEDASFYKLYFKDILSLDTSNASNVNFKSFEAWMKDSLTIDLFTKVAEEYKHFETVETDLKKMFQHLLYYFPNQYKIPDIYTFISGFAYQLFIFDQKDTDGLAIGLDMFLHPNIDYRSIDPNNTNFSDYITRCWNKDHIVKKVTDLYVMDKLGQPSGHRLLDQMVFNGKAMYLTQLLLPEVHDSIITEYSNASLAWCKDHELQMWSFFLGEKLIFESNPTKISKYIQPSPDSPNMPEMAPGRTANYMGWQIIKAYMKRYPDTTIEELISMHDSQKLLELSKFKPKNK